MIQPGKHLDLPIDDYHADPSASASRLKLAKKSIAHMLAGLGPKKSFDIGTAVHTLLLEGGPRFQEQIAIWPKTFQTKTGKESTSRNCTEAREWKERAEAEGLIILERSEAALIKQLGMATKSHPAAGRLLELSAHAREVSYFWRDDEFDVPCRCRFDAIAVEAGTAIAVDLKTTRSAFPSDFARDTVRYGYDLQLAHYAEGYRAIEGEELAAWTIIAVETEPPYGVAVYLLEEGDGWQWYGADDRRRAMGTFAEWWHAGRPVTVKPYPDEITKLERPSWAR